MTLKAHLANGLSGNPNGADLAVMPEEEAAEWLALRWNLTQEIARRRRQRELDPSNRSAGEQNMQAAALWYAKNGIPVFPLHWPTAEGCSCGKNPDAIPEDQSCRSIAKHPRTATGFKEATTDAEQITKWWTKWPSANIGIPTGEITQLLVVDSDPRNGGPADRRELIEIIGPIPETAEAITGGDGRHTYFRYPGGPVPKQLAKGIDLKGDGGYVVVPPSLHANGRRYQWDGTRGAKAILHPAEEPAWLVEFIRRDKTDSEPRRAAQLPETILDGQKHDSIVSVAGTLRKRGAPEAAAFAACRALSFQSPVSDEDIRTRVRSVYTLYPADTNTGNAQTNCHDKDVDVRADAEPESSGASVTSVTGSWPELIPLVRNVPESIPVKCLPGWLGEMAIAVSESTETPFEMAALLALAAVSSCVASRADVSPEKGYTEPLNLYVCPAMESGNRKTAVFNRVMAPIVDWERMEVERMEPERRRVLSKRRTMEGRIEHLRKQAAKGKDQAALIREILELEDQLPELLSPFRHFADDITSERIASLMEQQGGRIAIFSDEGGVFETAAGRYANGVPNLDVWLKGHSASPLRVDRQNPARPPIIIDKPHLTVALSPQPDVLAAMKNKPGFRGRGLIPRFLFALPKSTLGYRALVFRNVPCDIEICYEKNLNALLTYRPDPALRLVFAPTAYREWKDFQVGLEPQLRDGGLLEKMRDWGSKLPGAAARISAVLHMAIYAGRLDPPTEIDKPTVVAAVEMATALISHFSAVLELMERNPETMRAERVLAWIVRKRPLLFTARDCFRDHQRLFDQMSALTPTLKLLQDKGYIRISPQASSGGRPPSDLIEVNPALLGSTTP